MLYVLKNLANKLFSMYLIDRTNGNGVKTYKKDSL